MSQRIALVAALILGVVAVAHVAAKAKDPRQTPVKLGERPQVSLSPRPPLTDAQTQHIKELIASLSTLDKPDFGLSATMSGTNFAAIPGQEHAGALLLTDHGLGQSTALKELVTLGPDALPFLLDALDDKTPTKVTITHDHGFGAMWFARELDLNPVSPAEKALFDPPADKEQHEQYVKSYTIKVGDVCFVAIGQIVGRAYQAVRYQPTACVVLNSPTNDAKLCDIVRGIWKSEEPRRKLFDSLCADYATVGIFNGNSLDGWEWGNDLQCGAALRMLFYFPKETDALLAGRLDKLNVSKDVGIEDYIHRCVANEVRSETFINVVAWSPASAVRAALTGVFKRADDLDSLLAALPAVDDKDLIRSRLERRLIALPAEGQWSYGDGTKLLTAVLVKTPAAAKAMFDRYLQNATAERCFIVCVALRDEKVTWDVDVLFPMLTDTRTFGQDYAVVAGQNEPRLPIRVCDEAAVTLSRNHPLLKFAQVGSYADLDRQIAAIRSTLSERTTP
jgi:hypothetical protein